MKKTILMLHFLVLITMCGLAQENAIATEDELQPWIEAEKGTVRAKAGQAI